jgi:hypothetical protein
MKRLSAPRAEVTKFIAPIVAFGAFAMIALRVLVHEPEPEEIGGLLLIFVLGLFVFWRFYRSKVREVHDCGDSILVRSGSREFHIPLSDIASVQLTTGRPPHVRIMLKKQTPLGDCIEFFDGTSHGHPGHPVASEGVRELMKRVQRLHASSASGRPVAD